MMDLATPRSAFAAPPQAGNASGPAQPVPRRPLEGGGAALAGPLSSARRQGFSLQLSLPLGRPVLGKIVARG